VTLEKTPVCEHGIPARALSAWRDGDLPADEARRVADHVTACPASQTRLADYDALIRALRAQPVPPSDADRIWRAVRAHVRPSRGGIPMRTTSTRSRLIGSLSGIAAVLALLVGFVLALTHGAPGRPSGLTPAHPTATPSPSAVHGWSRVPLPANFTLSFPSFAIAPSDGNIAYACVVAEDANQNPRPGLSANQFWVTRDRGTHWKRMTDPPGSPVNQCSLQVDALNPAIVVAWGRSIPLYSTPPAGTPPVLSANGGGEFAAVTFDGGATWQQPTGDASPGGTRQLATSNGVTYAVRCCYSPPDSAERLMVSRDHMATWKPIDGAIVAAGEGVDTFSLRPDTGALLAVAFDVHTLDRHLWQSTDGGAHWSELPSPATSFADFYVVQQPVSGQPWHLCAETFKLVHDAGANPGPATGIVCSADGGYLWSSRPMPNASSAGFTLIGITSAGDLLAQDDSATAALYRLPAGSTQWQTVDTAPGTNVSVSFIPDPGSGVLWVVPIPPNAYSPYDPTGQIYTKGVVSQPG
jgi:hypothetical protein